MVQKQVVTPLEKGDSAVVFDDRAELLKNIKLIIRIRFFVSPSIFLLIFLAGAAGFTQQSALSRDQLIVNGFNVAGILVLNLTYALLLRRLKELRP